MSSFRIEEGVLRKYEGNEPHVAIPEGVKRIAFRAFYAMVQVQSVAIPEGVEVVDSQAFHGCSSLAGVAFPDSVNRIGSKTFCGCAALREIVLPDRVRSIGDSAFSGCDSLERIVLPAALQSMGEAVFENCAGLRRIRCVALPITAFEVEWRLALLNGFLTEPEAYPEERKSEYLRYLKSQKKRLLLQAVAWDDATTFAAYERMGLGLLPALRDELIDQAVKEKAQSVLAWLMDYKNRTANPQEEAREKDRVEQQEFDTPYLAKFLKADWKWSSLEDGTLCIEKYRGSAADVAIPPVIGKKAVTAIGAHAFQDCGRMESVVIPEGVTSIGFEAFSSCARLRSVAFPDSLTCIGDNAFKWCGRLQDVELPGRLASIGNLAFCGCTGLRSVVFPVQVIRIGTLAFGGCTGLESVIPPEHVTHIGARAFDDTLWQRQQRLVILDGILAGYSGRDIDLVIPEGVTSITDWIFLQEWRLRSITVPDSVTSIGEQAFYRCSALEMVSLPAHLPYDAAWGLPEHLVKHRPDAE